MKENSYYEKIKELRYSHAENAFTLAEMMVVMLVLSIILAASIPLITKKSSLDGSSIWKYVPADKSHVYYGTTANNSAMVGTKTPPASGSYPQSYGSMFYINTPGADTTNHPQLAFGVNGVPKAIHIVSNDGAIAEGYSIGGLGDRSVAIGQTVNAGGAQSIAMGLSANASGANAVALGYGATAAHAHATAVGVGAASTGTHATAIGRSASAGYVGTAVGHAAVGTSGTGNTVVGYDARTDSAYGTAIGASSRASYVSAAVGHDAQALYHYSVAMGYQSRANQHYSVAIGYGAYVTDSYATAIGMGAYASHASAAVGHASHTAGIYSSAYGYNSGANTNYSTALGWQTNASGEYSVASGARASAGGFAAASYGVDSSASGQSSVALGHGANASGTYAVAIGYGASAGANQIVLGNGANNQTVYIPGKLYLKHAPTNTYTALRRDNDAYIRWSSGSWLSDRRVKNIIENYKSSLDEVRKLKIYKYQFKEDAMVEKYKKELMADVDNPSCSAYKDNKKEYKKCIEQKGEEYRKYARKEGIFDQKHVGIVAQDLEEIFPNSVKTDKNGYKEIDTNEVFYAMLNSIKDLDEKVRNLSNVNGQGNAYGKYITREEFVKKFDNIKLNFYSMRDDVKNLKENSVSKDTFKSQIEEIKGNIRELKNQLAAHVNALREKISSLEDEVIAVKDNISKDVLSLKKDIKYIKNTLKAMENENNRLRNRISELEKEKTAHNNFDFSNEDMKYIKNTIMALEKENNNLRRRISELEKENAAITKNISFLRSVGLNLK